jgi:tight adherence protein B
VIALAIASAACAAWLWFAPHPQPRAIRLGIDAAPRWYRLPRWRAGATASETRALEALGALAAELRAGQPPIVALQQAGSDVWPQACAAARVGGDVTAALRSDAQHAPSLAGLAVCWEMAARSGSGMATMVQRIADAARTTQDTRVQLAAQLAGPRATARMLAALPLVGIVIGHLLGADPIAWLLGSPIGLAVLALAAACTALGWWWIHRIATHVEHLL